MNCLVEKYLRRDLLPFLWCPGCGDGAILSATLRAVDALGIRDRLALVGGIGCSGYIPTYIDADVMHVLHGRTLPFATALALTRPDRKVIVFTGDGDCVGIGGNHFIHAARRNVDVTVVMVNNQIYGMTGGQVAPTTPRGAKTKTSVYGNPEPPFDVCELARAAGATFIARWTVAHPRQLTAALVAAIEHAGFSLVEVVSPCPSQGGRAMYRTTDPGTLLDRLVADTVPGAKWEQLPADERSGKRPIGTLFVDDSRPVFAARLAQGDETGRRDAGTPGGRDKETSPVVKKKSGSRRVKVSIDPACCKGCALCVKFCPRGVFAAGTLTNARGYTQPEVAEVGRCVLCRTCEQLCPDLAISIEEVD